MTSAGRAGSLLVSFPPMRIATAESPGEWLIRKFEKTSHALRRGEIHWTQLGLGEVQDMIRLKADEHTYPNCHVCGWTGEGKQPLGWQGPLSGWTLPLFPLYVLRGERVVRWTEQRYLQAGLPPV